MSVPTKYIWKIWNIFLCKWWFYSHNGPHGNMIIPVHHSSHMNIELPMGGPWLFWVALQKFLYSCLCTIKGESIKVHIHKQWTHTCVGGRGAGVPATAMLLKSVNPGQLKLTEDIFLHGCNALFIHHYIFNIIFMMRTTLKIKITTCSTKDIYLINITKVLS